MLPNKLIWNNANSEDTYIHIYGNKIIHIFSYLDGMTNRFGKTIFTIKDMISSCGLKPKSGRDEDGKAKVNIQFKDILSSLQSEGIIKDIIKIKDKEINLENVNIDTYINCVLNIPIEKDESGNNTNFFTIPHECYLEIIDRYEGELNKLTLLEVYYYINARLSRREVFTREGKKISNDIEICGGKAECFYDSYAAIAKHLKITENTWNIYIKELQSMGLIFYDNIGLVKKNDRTHIANNVYVINKNELAEALKQSKLYYESNGYIILGKKTAKEIKVINGTKGKIAQEQNRNKDTSALENKLEKLENKKAKKKGLVNKKTESQEVVEVIKPKGLSGERKTTKLPSNYDEFIVPDEPIDIEREDMSQFMYEEDYTEEDREWNDYDYNNYKNEDIWGEASNF